MAVVGCGAFGRNHLRVYQALAGLGQPVEIAAVVDKSEGARETAALEYGVPAFASVEGMLAAGVPLDAASVCTPTVHHADTAVLLLAAGLDALIEKPIASSLAEADRILAAAREHGRVVAGRAPGTI